MVKRIVHTISIFFIITACILGSYYAYLYHALIPHAEKKLWSIMLSTENTINNYLREQEANIKTIATDDHTTNFLYQCITRGITRGPTSESASKDFLAFLAPLQEKMKFKNIILLDTNKNICFSTTQKQLAGKNLNSDEYKNATLTKSYDRSMMTLTTDFAEFLLDPVVERPALFITMPVVKNKKLIGIIAYEYDAQEIYRFVNQYTHLGKTGEIALAQKEESYIVFISPTRHNPDLAFQKRNLLNKVPLSIQKSVTGKQGTGTAIDYRSQPVAAAWTFLPRVNWGMVVKMDQSEILQPLTHLHYVLLLFLLLIFGWIIYLEWSHHKPIRKIITYLQTTYVIKHIPSPLKNIYLLLFLLCSGILFNSIAKYYYASTSAMHQAQQEIMLDTSKDAEKIEQILNKISFTAQSIADDLQSYRLTNEDIEKRIKRDIAENNNILSITVAFAPHAYNDEAQLFAPSVTKKDNAYIITNLAENYDYTNPQESSQKTGWYHQTLEKGSVWFDPHKDPKGHNIPPVYAHVFFDKNNQPRGVVAITYNLEIISRIAEYSSLNRVGYSILMTEHGQFIFHPINTLVDSKKTLLEYAEENGNEQLAVIAKQIKNNKPLLASYTSSSKQQLWIYTHPITTNKWVLGAIFPKDDISLQPQTVRVYYFWILAYAILWGLLLCAYLFNRSIVSWTHLSFFVNGILVIGLLCSWKIIRTTAIIERTNANIITDQASLDKFLDDLQEEATRKNESTPIKIPCGLLLYSIDLPASDHMTISGYMWNKYNLKEHTRISHRMQIPHAIRLAIGAPFTSIADDWETVTWNIRGTIYQKQSYAQFPFDKRRMQITLEHHDIEKNIILTPDLTAYKKISPEETPGLDKRFTLSDFNVEQTFFNYKKIDASSNFGFKEYGKATDHFQLIYNIVAVRGLLNPFILFFLPLLAVLFSLFSILVIAKKTTDPLTIIASYTGLFFALILLQRSLRESYPTNVTMYIEYPFFYTYITIILLVIHTVIVYLYPHWDNYQKKFFPLVKFLFWPTQLASWIITTLIVFY